MTTGGIAPTLLMIRGNSGSGKTSTAQEVRRRYGQRGLAVVEQDYLRRQIVHQCGTHGLDEIREATGGLAAELAGRYRLVAYLHDELPDVRAAAEVVVARSGAGTVAELTALGKAMVLIPMISAEGDEQRRTARHLADHDAAIMLAAADATCGRLRETILGLLRDPVRCRKLAGAARAHGRPDAVERVVDEVLAAADHPRSSDAYSR